MRRFDGGSLDGGGCQAIRQASHCVRRARATSGAWRATQPREAPPELNPLPDRPLVRAGAEADADIGTA